jgi:HEAT repeat protein
MKTAIVLGTALVCITAGTAQAESIKKKDVPKYIGLLKSAGSANVRADAAEALGHRGAIKKADVVEAVDPLIEALKTDRDAKVRKAAATALASIQPDNNAAVKPLMEALTDKSYDVRIAAANGLGAIGPDASDAVDALREAKAEVDKDLPKKGSKKKPTKAEREKQQFSRALGMALRNIGGKKKK